jgi:zinc/manganese transport system substrate-binding protein
MQKVLWSMFVVVGLQAVCLQAEPLRVASLNPIATDLVRQVGGDQVVITELMKPGQDPHSFQPSPSDLMAAEKADLVVAMGKGLETYLDKLSDTLGGDTTIYELGRMIPSLRLNPEQALFACCPAHAHGAADPHWWHDVGSVQRAVKLLAKEMEKASPEHADTFKTRSKDTIKQLKRLDDWIDEELSVIPVADRRLTTAHTAFNYFCDRYRFKPLPVLGLSSLESPEPGQIRHVLERIKAENIKAIFPEYGANPAPLKAVAKEAGITLGDPLLAGSPLPESPTYEAMMRSNVNAIVAALAPKAKL